VRTQKDWDEIHEKITFITANSKGIEKSKGIKNWENFI